MKLPPAIERQARLAQHDKEIAAIRKLLLQGMKMLVRIEAAQEKTEKKLQTLIDTLTRGRNGKDK